MASKLRPEVRQEVGDSPPHDHVDGPCDLVLMERVRESDAEAFAWLLRRYWQRLLQYGRSVTGDADSAEDIVQETFVRVWRNRQSWVSSGSVSAFLYRITRNLALNRERDDRSRRIRSGHVPHTQLPIPTVRTPEQDFESTRVVEQVEAAIETLPPRRREIFILSRFHQLTHAEIAEAMEISPQTVANQITTALADLRSELSHLLRHG